MKRIRTPLIIVNFKAYEESTGRKAIRLAKICEDVSKKYKVSIAVSPQFCDIYAIAQEIRGIPILSQHIDPVEPSAYTGHVTALAVKEAGAIGTLINHSERRLKPKDIGECIKIARKLDLITVCCSDSIVKSKEIAKSGPDFIAYEPPELIGTGVSVSKTKPEVVSRTVDLIKKVNPRIKVLCGAGITAAEDVRKALQLGTVGVLVASGVVKAGNPKKVLTEFADVIKR
jgi:triosephosphate isomerase